MTNEEATARELLGGMTAACIKRNCMPGECLQGCLARVEIIAAALSAARREEQAKQAVVASGEIVDLIDQVRLALNDWIVSYAPDMCADDDVEATKKRLSEFGTLAYICNANLALRDIASAVRSPSPKEGNAR